MRAYVLALAASCTVVFACVPQPPTSIDNTGGGGSGTGNGTTSSTTTTSGAGGTGAGGSSSAARTYFEDRVSPIMEADCASCHSGEYTDAVGGPDFMGNSKDQYYNSLVARPDFVNADPDSSYLLTKGAHSGPAFEPGDAEMVKTWLEMEADIKDPGGTTVEGPSGEELIEQFVACMEYTDWLSTGIYLAAEQTTLQGKTCFGCHESGVGGNFMTNPNNEASKATGFDMMKSIDRIGVLVRAVAVVGADNKQRNELVQSCRWHDKPNGGGDHLKYSLAPTYQGYVDDWFALVMDKCFQIQTDSTCQ